MPHRNLREVPSKRLIAIFDVATAFADPYTTFIADAIASANKGSIYLGTLMSNGSPFPISKMVSSSLNTLASNLIET